MKHQEVPQVTSLTRRTMNPQVVDNCPVRDAVTIREPITITMSRAAFKAA